MVPRAKGQRGWEELGISTPSSWGFRCIGREEPQTLASKRWCQSLLCGSGALSEPCESRAKPEPPPRPRGCQCQSLCVTPWIVARQAPLSMGFSRQEYGSGLPCPSPEPLTMELMQSRWTAGRAGGYWRVCKTRLARAQEHTGTSRGRSIPHIQEKESTQEEKKKSVSVPVSFYFR